MNRLSEIATDISHALEDKTGINIRLGHQRRDLEARQRYLIPGEGWPGKNAEERKINEQRTYANDPVCQTTQKVIDNLEEALALVETVLETLTTERRALEWRIRAQLVEAITGNVITTQNGHAHVEDTAFDDFADDTADARLEEKYVNPALASDVPWEDDPTVNAEAYDEPVGDPYLTEDDPNFLIPDFEDIPF